MEEYKTRGTVSEEVLRDVIPFLLSRRQRLAPVLLTALSLAAAVLNYRVGSTLIGTICAVAAVLLLLWPGYLRRGLLKSICDRLREVYPGGRYQYESSFNEEGAALHNLTNDGRSFLAYRDFDRACETDRVFFLATKAGQFFLVFKDCLTQEQLRSFPGFLKERCPGLKVRR